MTSSSIALLRNSDAVASLRPPLSVSVPIQRSLSPLQGAPLSTWWRIDIRSRVRDSAWTKGSCWSTCALDRWHNRACRVLASVAPQQGHLVARNSSIPIKRRLADINSNAGMTLDESMGLAFRKAVAPGPDWLLFWSFAKPLVSFSPIWVTRAPRGCRVGVLFRRCDVPVTPYPIFLFPQSVYGLCWSLWLHRHVLAALQQSTALRYPAVLV